MMVEKMWPVDWPEGSDTDLSPVQRERAEELAVSSLRMLTLNRPGLIPITVIPCRHDDWRHMARRIEQVRQMVGLTFGLSAECLKNHRLHWRNEVRVAAPIYEVTRIRSYGETLPPDAYQVLNGGIIVRADGGSWPMCSGSGFSIEYTYGYPVSAAGRFAAGVLAEEFSKAMNDDSSCRLPANVTEVSRAGMTYQMEAGVFPEGFTGLKDVDAYIYQWNPHGMKTRPTVHSPDLGRRVPNRSL